jgi:deoxyadenosine/deoxycytidine kinase
VTTGWMSTLRHIAVCGNIGSGKTTLTEKLAKHYGWNALYESVDTNPYLRDFYTDMSKWAFHVQIYFLNSRFRQINEIQGSDKPTIQDRTIYEDAYIFAANLHKNGHMSERDYQSYLDIFRSMITFVKPPDLLIYLKANIPKLVKQIEKRGRDFEYAITLDYLRQLNKQYDSWIANYRDGKLLTIDVNDLDFVEDPDDFSFVVSKIDYELNNLFE